MGRPGPGVRGALARRASAPGGGRGTPRRRRVRDRSRGRPLARRRPAGDRPHLLPGPPGSPLGMDDPRAGLRAAPLHGSRLAPRLGGATAVPQGLPRDPDPRRVGEPARQRGSRSIPHGAPRGDRPRRLARTARGAGRGADRPRAAGGARDAVRTVPDARLLPADAARPTLRGLAHRVAAERPRLGHARVLLPRGCRRRGSRPRPQASAPLRSRPARLHVRRRRARDPRDPLVRARLHGSRAARARRDPRGPTRAGQAGSQSHAGCESPGSRSC